MGLFRRNNRDELPPDVGRLVTFQHRDGSLTVVQAPDRIAMTQDYLDQLGRDCQRGDLLTVDDDGEYVYRRAESLGRDRWIYERVKGRR